MEVRRPPLRSHDDLEAYQSSMRLLPQVHEVCRHLPREERHDLASQMRRASKSIPANIAEGFSRRATVKEFRQYMRMAMGSANEMETHLKIAKSLGYAAGPLLDELIDEYNHIGRQLNRLSATWQQFPRVEPRTSNVEHRGQ